MKVYIAGPMTGLPDSNYPAFHEKAEELREAGVEVYNPAENHEGRTDLPLREYFKADLPQICDSDALVVLPGWEGSPGVGVEVALALHLGMPILHAETLEPIDVVAQQPIKVWDPC